MFICKIITKANKEAYLKLMKKLNFQLITK